MLLASNPGAPGVYRLRATTRLDSDGDPVESWLTPSRLLLRAAQVQPVRSGEEEGARLLSGERLLLVPGSVDLTAADRIEYEGQVWHVDGDPARRRGLASGVYTAATLTRTERTA